MRMFVLSLVLLAGGASLAWSQAAAAAAQPPTLDPNNFTGTVTPHVTSDIRLTRYTFSPGARSNWHSHEGGQVIIVERGRMRVQERGAAGRELGPSQTYTVGAGTIHWHGALPGEPLTQVALSYGVTAWMEQVTDAQYAAAARK